MAKKKKPKKRATKYEQKLTLKDDVTFDALIGVAVNYQPKKKAAATKKKKS